MGDIALKNLFLFLLKLLTANTLLRDEQFNSLVEVGVYQCEKMMGVYQCEKARDMLRQTYFYGGK